MRRLLKSKAAHARGQSRRVGLAFVLVVGSLMMLTATGWAAWGAGLRSLSASLQAHLTATPTKTPRPVTPAPTQVPVDLSVVVVAPTSTPAREPTVVPEPEPTSEPMPVFLAEVARAYGINPARRFIVIDIATQKMTIWDPGKPVKEMPVSTGDETKGYRTPSWYGLVGDYWGTFSTQGVYADEGWYLFEDTGSILIHSTPYRLVNGAKIHQDMDALGNYPASRGCVRLSPEDARWFTEWGPKGVPLVILPKRA